VLGAARDRRGDAERVQLALEDLAGAEKRVVERVS